MPTDTPALTFDCGCDEFQSCPRCTTQLEPNWLAKELEDVTMPNPVAEVVERLNAEIEAAVNASGPGMPAGAAMRQLQFLLEDARNLIERLSRERDTGVPETEFTDTADANLAFLDQRANEWMAETSVQRMFNAMASVFEKHASQDLMDRFRKKLGELGHQCFVEGAMRAWDEISRQQRRLGQPLPRPDATAAPQPPTVSTQGWQDKAVAVLEEIDAIFDKQVYCLPPRPDPTPFALREADQDIPADYEHCVVITEAIWDKIRAAISAPGIVDLSTLTRERDQAREALEPFATFGERNVDENGWKSNIHREQISTWFGPSDFQRARSVLHPEKEEKA